MSTKQLYDLHHDGVTIRPMPMPAIITTLLYAPVIYMIAVPPMIYAAQQHYHLHWSCWFILIPILLGGPMLYFINKLVFEAFYQVHYRIEITTDAVLFSEGNSPSQMDTWELSAATEFSLVHDDGLFKSTIAYRAWQEGMRKWNGPFLELVDKGRHYRIAEHLNEKQITEIRNHLMSFSIKQEDS